jgi:hypothetical protein
MKSTSMVRMDRQRKIKMAVSRVAVQLAAQKKDPLYDKYQKYRKLYLEYKAKIVEKYGPKAVQVVRQSIAQNQG